MKFGSLLSAFVLLTASQLEAQTASNDVGADWHTSYFPYLTASPNDGLMGMFRVVNFRVARWDDRVSLHDGIAIEGGYSTRNSWLLRARADFPRIANGWRVEADAQVSHTDRFGDPSLYQRRNLANAGAEVTQQIVGGLHLSARVEYEHLHQKLPDSRAYSIYPSTYFVSPCVYVTEPAADGKIDDCTPGVTQNDFRGRVAVILDLRNREYNTENGALFEAGFFKGTSEEGYQGGYGIARGWVTPVIGARVTGRVGFRAMSKTSAIGILHQIPAWEHPVLVLGGPNSNRGLGLGEDVGRGILLGGAEIRQEVFKSHNIAAVSLLAFVDGGRTFRDPSPLFDPVPGTPIPSGKLQFTFKDWHWSVGGGVAVRVLRDAQITLTAARGEGKTRVYLSTGWSW